MKKTVSLIMVAVLVLLCGCTSDFPVNNSFTTVPDQTQATAGETTSVLPETQAPATAKPTEKQTQKQTEKPSETATQPPATQQSEEAETTERSGSLSELLTGASSAFDGMPADRPDTPDYDSDKPMLALTFDDGPSAHTERLLNIFKAHGGKGTFFVVGTSIERNKALLKRMAEEGHEIGNHSWSHPQLTDLGRQDIVSQITRTSDKIYEASGQKCRLVRPPYGSYNDTVQLVGASLGVSYILWSVDTLDWKTKNADAVYNSVMSSARDGAIILVHDLHKTTVDAMEKVVPALLKKGYQLVTVSELLTSDGGKLEPGKVYRKR